MFQLRSVPAWKRKSYMTGSGSDRRSIGEKLSRIFWLVVVLCLTATLGAGWALAIYALLILLIVALAKFAPKRGG